MRICDIMHIVTMQGVDYVLIPELDNNPDYELLWDSEEEPAPDEEVYAPGTYRIYKRQETR